jgi:pimeloyl-ACP methyl ester carboxylesterase
MPATHPEVRDHRDRERPTAGDDARRRLLAGVPVTERRLDLAGVPTAVLEGGDGPPPGPLDADRMLGWLGELMPEPAMPAIPAADLDRIAVPTTLIWGRQDLQVRLAVAEAAGARHGWPLQVIDHAGDDPPMEQPAAFLAALRAALAGTR